MDPLTVSVALVITVGPVYVPTRFTVIEPPSRLTLPEVGPMLRETSKVPHLSWPVRVTLNTPVPRLQRNRVCAVGVPTFSVPPLRFTVVEAPALPSESC